MTKIEAEKARIQKVFDSYGIETNPNLIERLLHYLPKGVFKNSPISGKAEIKKFFKLLEPVISLQEIKIKTSHGTFRFHKSKQILRVFEDAIGEIQESWVVIPPFKKNKAGEYIAPKATKRKREFTATKMHDFQPRLERVINQIRSRTTLTANRKIYPVAYDLMNIYWQEFFRDVENPNDTKREINNLKTSFINSILKQKNPTF